MFHFKQNIISPKLFYSIGILLLGLSSSGYSVTYDGQGHYSLLAQTRTNPGFSKSNGLHEAIYQNFRLMGEIRSTENTSFFVELSLFENRRSSYLGDTTLPEDCSTQQTSAFRSEPCTESFQNSGEPRYTPFLPRVRKAYAQFAFDKCLLQAGRRGRSWGIGIFLDEGTGPFSQDSTVFDGVSCNINLQKTQTLSVLFGFDKISESGSAVSAADSSAIGGSTARSDDIDQYFFALEYDDRKVNTGGGLSQKVGVYFANVLAGDRDGTSSDIKFADLYTSFYLSNFIFKNELLFRLGKSKDPSWARLGGAYPLETSSSDDERVSNDLSAIAFAGELEFILSSNGSVIGPEDYFRGNKESHSLFFQYAYAPGDADGYRVGSRNGSQFRTDTKASAVAFHRNYKPALILFNDVPQNDRYRIDGIYDPGRVMNATVFGLGYKYQSLESGNFELKLIGASLNSDIDAELTNEILAEEASDAAIGALSKDRPIGFSSKNLGIELDLKYSLRLGKSVEVGAAGAIALPGDAFKVQRNESPVTSLLVQSHISFFF